eukprot:1266751-Rhodomonas_salina.6
MQRVVRAGCGRVLWQEEEHEAHSQAPFGPTHRALPTPYEPCRTLFRAPHHPPFFPPPGSLRLHLARPPVAESSFLV